MELLMICFLKAHDFEISWNEWFILRRHLLETWDLKILDSKGLPYFFHYTHLPCNISAWRGCAFVPWTSTNMVSWRARVFRQMSQMIFFAVLNVSEKTDKSIRFNVWNDENRSSRSLSTCCFCKVKQYKSEWNPLRLRVKDLDGSLVAFGVVLLPPGMLPLKCNIASSSFVRGTQYCGNFVEDSSWRNDDIGRFIKMVIEWFAFSKSHVNAQEAWCSNDTKELATMVPSALPPTCLNCTSTTAGL